MPSIADVDPARKPLVCRIVGCSNALHIHLLGAKGRFAGVYPISIEGCHDGTCATWTVLSETSECASGAAPFGTWCSWSNDAEGALLLTLLFDEPRHQDGGIVHADVKVQRCSGIETIFEGIGDASLSNAHQPNGPNCPPVCYSEMHFDLG